MKIEVIGRYSALLADVKILGRANADKLGFFPEGAFDKYASNKTILAVTKDDKVLGYLLYRISYKYSRAMITHLCIDETCRKQGIATALVNELIRKTKMFRGIGLYCRRDYLASTIWPKFGFVAKNEKEGRSVAGMMLTLWWYDHNHPTIFNYEFESTKLNAVLDANVFFDFANNQMRNESHVESLALRTDWMLDSIELRITDEMYNEISRNENKQERARLRQIADEYSCMEYDKTLFLSLEPQVRPFFAQEMSIHTESDFRQLVKAIAAKADFFVTRDSGILELRQPIKERFNITIVRPTELYLQQDELRREMEYQPARLAGTLYQFRRVNAPDVSGLADHFLDRGRGETKGEFNNILQSSLVASETTGVFVALDRQGQFLAIYISEYGESEMRVRMLRVAKNNISSTLARYLVMSFIKDCSTRKYRVLRMVDKFLQSNVEAALEESKFINTNEGWIKISIPLIDNHIVIADEIKIVASTLGSDKEKYLEAATFLSNISESEDFITTSSIEKTLWPCKVSDSKIPTYIIPIKSRWAKDLFDEHMARETLFGASLDLAFNIESVYYRSHKPNIFRYPARLLWYVSADSQSQWSKQLRACSVLDEVIVGKPKDLFRRFRRLGVYEWNDIKSTAHNDLNQEIMVLRFSFTELFSKQVSLHKTQNIIFSVMGKKPTFQGPYAINSTVFSELYRIGVDR